MKRTDQLLYPDGLKSQSSEMAFSTPENERRIFFLPFMVRNAGLKVEICKQKKMDDKDTRVTHSVPRLYNHTSDVIMRIDFSLAAER